MPIDIGSGSVELQFDDISIPGKVDLVWDRRYSTAFLDHPARPLGKGWTNRYFATLTQMSDGFEFVAVTGVAEFLTDAEGLVERGGRACNFGAFLEVFKERQHYIVQNWDVETGEVWRYRFAPRQRGQPWPLTSIEDVTGQAVDLIWSTAGSLTAVKQQLEQRTLLLSYTPSGLVERVTFQAPNGEAHTVAWYEYDADGRLTAAYDAADNADRYEYDRDGRVTREIVKDGGVFSYRYDSKGRCIKFSGLDRYDEKRLRFLDAVSITELTDSYDRTFLYQHLPSGQIVREIDQLGGEKNTDYDEYGRIVAKIDATGAVTRYAYDGYGNRATVTNALDNTHIFAYNEHHLPLSITDPLGQVWRRAYDGANRLISMMDPLGHRWLIRYDAEGNVAEIQNPLGARKRQQYTQGILNAMTDWLANETRFRLDTFGRVIERQGPLGDIIRFRYDQLGNPIEVLLPDGARLHATYDSVGNLTSFIDGNGYTTRFRYGPCQRLLERIDPLGGVVRYVWGSEPRRLEQVINEKGETYRFFRDDAGRIVREQSFDAAERHFKYDAEGYAIAYTNANGETVSIQRDALHRVIGQTLPDGGQVTYGFDPSGNLITAGNADIAVAFERDPLGRIVREVQGQHWVESRYDPLGNLIHTATSFGHTVEYEVDANGFVKKLTTFDNHTLAFKRNAYGQETNRQMPGGMVMEQRYDDVGRLIEQRVGPGRVGNGNVSVIPPQREIIRRTYTYDLNSALTSIVDGQWGRIDYIYDSAERLLQALREQGPSESFSYDPAGNITCIQTKIRESTEETLEYAPGNRLLQKGSTRYEYDTEGRRIKKIEAANSNNPKVWHYEWDTLDRLRAMVRPDGEVWRYKYDALGRRIKKAGPHERRHFLWDKDVVIHELDEARSLSTWMFDDYSFGPLATLQDARVYFIINDHLGTPKELLASSGRVEWSMPLKAWGAEFRKDRNNSGVIDCPIRFQGQWYDEESGLFYSKFRYYDPTIGGFLCIDPLRLWQGLNFYSYVCNPINWIDPLGLTEVDPKTINFSQRNVSGEPGQNPVDYQRDMEAGNWDWNRSGPIRVMDVNGQLVTYDNRRLMAAQNANLPTVPIEIVDPNAVIPVQGAKKTWATAFRQRLNEIRNRNSGGALPPSGRKEQPDIEDPKRKGCRS